MPKFYTSWTVLPHSPIEKVAENLWSVDAKMGDGKTQRRMVLARLRDGSIIVHNGIALDEPSMKELDAFGRVAAIVVPNGFHRMDALIWKQRYPNAKVYCPKGATKRVAQVVAVDGDYTAAPSDDTVRISHLDGLKNAEGVLEVKSQDGTSLVFNDALLNMPPRKGFQGFFLHPTGRASVPRVMRLLAMKDKRAFSAQLSRLADTTGLKRVFVAHGKTIETSPNETLKSVVQELG